MLEPFYCGLCVGALNGGRCPHCGHDWPPAEWLTETEARAFNRAYLGPGLDDDLRWATGWLAIDRLRARAQREASSDAR